jgi:hypothetical protein
MFGVEGAPRAEIIYLHQSLKLLSYSLHLVFSWFALVVKFLGGFFDDGSG